MDILPLEACDGSVVDIYLWILLLEVCQFLVTDVYMYCIDLDMKEGIENTIFLVGDVPDGVFELCNSREVSLSLN